MSSPHDPYRLGYTRVTKVVHKKKRSRKSERILKSHLSSDCPLQLEGMKVESLVIVDQHATVKQYLSFVLPARHALKGGPVVKSCWHVRCRITFYNKWLWGYTYNMYGKTFKGDHVAKIQE